MYEAGHGLRVLGTVEAQVCFYIARPFQHDFATPAAVTRSGVIADAHQGCAAAAFFIYVWRFTNVPSSNVLLQQAAVFEAQTASDQAKRDVWHGNAGGVDRHRRAFMAKVQEEQHRLDSARFPIHSPLVHVKQSSRIINCDVFAYILNFRSLLLRVHFCAWAKNNMLHRPPSMRRAHGGTTKRPSCTRRRPRLRGCCLRPTGSSAASSQLLLA